jgi:hypothetical protein
MAARLGATATSWGAQVTEQEVQRWLLDAITDAVAGSEWAPVDGGVLTEAVVVLGWVTPDGDEGWSWIGTRASWSSEGLLRHALRKLDDDHRAGWACDDEETE